MTVHTKLIMSVSLQNKGERHVQPQQGPKLIPQPQSRHTTQHADGQTCRHTCTDSQAFAEMYTIAIHFFGPIFSLHIRTHLTFSALSLSDYAIFVLSRLQRQNICSPHEHYCIHLAEEAEDLTDTRMCQ